MLYSQETGDVLKLLEYIIVKPLKNLILIKSREETQKSAKICEIGPGNSPAGEQIFKRKVY